MGVAQKIKANLIKPVRIIGKKFLLKFLYPNLYKHYAKAAISENKVVFIETRARQITSPFQLMYKTLQSDYNFELCTVFLLIDNCSRLQQIKSAIAMIREVATARYVFLNDGFSILSNTPIRKGTFFTQLWHGCGAFKKFGFSTADLLFGASKNQQLKYPSHNIANLVTVSSPEVVWAYQEAMRIDKSSDIVMPLGVSRTDIFYDKDFLNSAKARLEEFMPCSRGKKVILYAPTFRGRTASATAPRMLSLDKFYRHFNKDYVIVMKQHPFVKQSPVIPEKHKNFAVDVQDEMSIDQLISVADICISDYSSLVFEYSLFEKPMLFYAYDYEDYCDWRGFFYPYNELSPGPICTNDEQMIDFIENIEAKFDKQAIVDFKNKFMSSCDGNATKRILEKVFAQNLNKYAKS